ncbi:hypothetical protein [Niastella populi]|uniref:Lipoprotein n=1 Tax=Niastella populi TaxID=550983 RepID=A0A1V9EGQ4_9BACT|nr:hypothetical protein [Niastella populi]OQP45306.1 hypothetical protein A4R26_32350 [Niastella populi]
MSKLIPFLCILFLFSCGHSQSDTANAPPLQKDTVSAAVPQKDTAVNIFLDTVNAISNRTAELTNKEVEDLLHAKYFTAAEFKVTPRQNVTGKLKIYSVQVTGDLPTAQPTEYTFIDVRETHLQFLLPIEFNQLYEIEGRIMIGGIYTSREYEYYSVYELGSYMNVIFTTNIPGRERIVTGYFKDDECIDYIPDRLRFQFNRQTNDILFTGNARRYCQEGRDRAKNDKVIESITLKLVFHYKNSTWELDKKKSHYFAW